MEKRRALTWFTRVGHEEVWAERLDLVLIYFHLNNGARGGGVCGNDDIVLACESE